MNRTFVPWIIYHFILFYFVMLY